MMNTISENLDRMSETLNEHYGEISFKIYEDYYEYYNYVLSLNINDSFNKYSEYCINEVMNKHHHYTAYLRLKKLQKINNEDDITNQY